ncbi:MAG: tRNA lysidine(34) synthetase TilS [Bdellovibrionales bacterium]|nr:tRNA lysidine(34) synthetase TilS [Bdellovibrionales bacterium]
MVSRNSQDISALARNLMPSMPDARRFIVGVSGGLDSVCLLSCLVELQQLLDLDLVVAHVDHSLRECSRFDAEFVRSLAEQSKLGYEETKVSLNRKTKSIEQWGREVRYRFFRSLRELHKADYIITAHTASDFVETYVMRLMANKEIGRGILFRDPETRLFRPFLNIFRPELVAHSEEHGIQFREDPTNSDPKYLRNKIRHFVIPLLRAKYGDSVERALLIHAQEASKVWYEKRSSVGDSLAAIEAWRTEPAKWFRHFEHILRGFAVDQRWILVQAGLYPELKFNLGRHHCDRVVEFLLEKRRSVQLPAGRCITRSKGQVFWEAL